MYIYSQKKEKTFLKILVTIILTAGVTFGVTMYYFEYTGGDDNVVQRLSTDDNIEDTQESGTSSITSIISGAMESVVGVSQLTPDGTSIFDINFADKWGLGTGIVVSSKGYILTNQHLANKVGSKVTITLNNGKSVQGRTIWAESNIDLALIKVDYSNLKPINLGDCNNIQIGEDVMAIGNPLGLEFQRSVTAGIISGLNRTLKIEEEKNVSLMEGLIQTDASINPGNSGGPLINKDGEVIGINTVKITSAEGIGFAVPINIVKPIIEKLEATGKFVEAELGIIVYDKEVVPYINSRLSIDKGIYVVSINDDGPCADIGLSEGDVITKFNGKEVNRMVELRTIIYECSPGDEAILTIISGGSEKTLRTLLGKK